MDDKVKNLLEWLYCIIMAIILALLFRYYVGTSTVVRNVSMYPTLIENQRLWLSRTRKNTTIERGDIITFEIPSALKRSDDEYASWDSIAKYENEPKGFFNRFSYYVLELGKSSFIKRVIALPGEHIEIKYGKVYIDDQELKEDYLQEGIYTDEGTFHDIIVPKNCVFAMGDNRPNSTDCRDFGCIPLKKIEGKVSTRIWPLNVFGKVK